MMQAYYVRISWVSGFAFLTAFFLTFWPSRSRMTFAAVLWSAGTLAIAGFSAYSMFLRGGIAYAFSSSGGFPLFAWLIPLVELSLAVTESILLFPQIPQEQALRLGRVLFLTVVPVIVFLVSLPQMMESHFWRFPLGIEWLGLPLLWFRIRENSSDQTAYPSSAANAG